MFLPSFCRFSRVQQLHVSHSRTFSFKIMLHWLTASIHIHSQIPKLFDEECDQTEGKLTLEECQRALKSIGNGKSPGENGFTVEFYKDFVDF